MKTRYRQFIVLLCVGGISAIIPSCSAPISQAVNAHAAGELVGFPVGAAGATSRSAAPQSSEASKAQAFWGGAQ